MVVSFSLSALVAALVNRPVNANGERNPAYCARLAACPSAKGVAVGAINLERE